MSSIRYIALLLAFLPVNLLGQAATLPYQTGFDSSPTGWTSTTINGTSWELGIPSAAGTQGSFSAPNCWGTDLDSGYRANSHSFLTSPVLLAGSAFTPYIQFRQFRYMSTGLDGFHLELSINGQPWTLLNAINPGDTSNWYNSVSLFTTGHAGFTGISSGGWQSSGIRLPSMQSGDSIRVRFVFRSNASFGSAQPGVFIDNFEVFDSTFASIDVMPVSITYPGNSLPAPQTTPLKVIVRNQSLVVIDSIRVGFSVDGSPFTQQTLAFGLPPSFADTFLFGSVNWSAGPHTLSVVASTSGDASPWNDTLTTSIQVQNISNLTSIPYFNDFETDTSGWRAVTTGVTQWEYGTPAFGSTNGAFSGLKCWDINLYTGYGPSAFAVLESPPFDFSQSLAPYISFALKNVTENAWDGVRLDYTLNNGTTWLVLGTVNDPLAQEWYNDLSINSTNLPGWTGVNSNWKLPRYRLNSFAGTSFVKFRFVFSSDISINLDGVSLDDFRIDELPSHDLVLDSVLLPYFSYPTGNASGPVRLRVTNNGGQPASGFTYSYQVNNGPLIIQTYSGTLAAGASLYFSLPGFILQQGIQTLCAQINWSPDVDPSNNYSCVAVAGVPTDTLTYDAGFDQGPAGWVQRSYGPGSSSTRWEWGTPQYGSTNTAHSPPFAWDINLDSAYAANVTCELYTPIFDLSNALQPVLSFWQNRAVHYNSDGLRIDYRLNQDSTWFTLGITNDANGTNWYNIFQISSSLNMAWHGYSGGWIKSSYNLDAIQPGTGTIQFRFVFSSGLGGADGVSIDDFQLRTDYVYDASLTAIPSPSGILIAGAQVPLEVNLKNEGSQTITGLSISSRINGGIINTIPWTGNLLRDSSVTVNLGLATVNAGPNNVEAWVNWAADQYAVNDTIRSPFTGLPTQTLPYFEDFESGDGFWYNALNTPGTRWEYGTPGFAPLNSAFSGSYCWDVNLTTPYGNLAYAVLASPAFNISGMQEVLIDFWHSRRTETDVDGTFLEYSIDGVNWQVLGQLNDSLGSNWYNGSLYGGRSGWSGIGTGWTRSSYRFKPAPGTAGIRLRFIFLSDASIVDAGFSIDDVRISLSTGVDENPTPANGITVYPNPAQHLLNIRVLGKESQVERIRITDTRGAIVKEITSGFMPTELIQLDTESISGGIYSVTVLRKDGSRQCAPFVILE